jgi:NRAMP (natural resistance-associated macrophage protein)-like metal ion transporter
MTYNTEEATILAPLALAQGSADRGAQLDSEHVGDIRGGFGTIFMHDTRPRTGWSRLKTLLAILGPGVIVMVGDNDAGAFGTYTQAAQNYGTTLVWTLLLLIPVLYVNQDMVLRLGAVTGVGHARLILERFGKFWGAFSVIDLFLLNGLTIVTEFIGLNLAFDYLGVSKFWGIGISALVIMASVSTGDLRRFERFALVLVFGSLLLVPVLLMSHPPVPQVAHDLFVPRFPVNAPVADVMLLIIAIVGTTVAPWQLFFQQSYVVDKRITPRYIPYERIDLWLGIGLIILGAVAMMAFTAVAFKGTPEYGHFKDAGAVATGIGLRIGRTAGVFFAVALIDACIIGAAAVSLSTAYAIGDVLSMRHSLHRKVGDAKGFYAVYFGLIVISAAVVLTPGAPLGLLTNAVQTLAGVLLPSATVFLLLLCNDKAILGPWANDRKTNIFTSIVIAILVMLSVILTASVLFPAISGVHIIAILVGGSVLALLLSLGARLVDRRRGPKIQEANTFTAADRTTWRMAPLAELPPARLTVLDRTWLIVLRGYLIIAAGLVLVRIVMLVIPGH